MRVQELRKKSTQGFTIVELVIVVAIIAVLSAMLAPRYILYIEKAKIGVDEAYVGEVASSLKMIAATDVKINTCPVTVTFDTAGKIQNCTASGPHAAETEAAVNAYLADIYPDSKQQFKSDYYTGTGSEVSSGVTLVLDAQGMVAISGTKNINS